MWNCIITFSQNQQIRILRKLFWANWIQLTSVSGAHLPIYTDDMQYMHIQNHNILVEFCIARVLIFRIICFLHRRRQPSWCYRAISIYVITYNKTEPYVVKDVHCVAAWCTHNAHIQCACLNLHICGEGTCCKFIYRKYSHTHNSGYNILLPFHV